jgi:hypothetical protein
MGYIEHWSKSMSRLQDPNLIMFRISGEDIIMDIQEENLGYKHIPVTGRGGCGVT